MRSHVSPQWFEALLMLMCTVHRRMKEEWWERTKIMMCLMFPCLLFAPLLLLPPACHSYSSKRLSLNPGCSSCLLLYWISSCCLLFRSVNIDKLASAASSWQVEAASYLCVFLCFSLSLLLAWSLQRKAPSLDSPSSHTYPCRLTHTLPFLSSPSLEVANAMLMIIYHISGPVGF